MNRLKWGFVIAVAVVPPLFFVALDLFRQPSGNNGAGGYGFVIAAFYVIASLAVAFCVAVIYFGLRAIRRR